MGINEHGHWEVETIPLPVWWYNCKTIRIKWPHVELRPHEVLCNDHNEAKLLRLTSQLQQLFSLRLSVLYRWPRQAFEYLPECNELIPTTKINIVKWFCGASKGEICIPSWQGNSIWLWWSLHKENQEDLVRWATETHRYLSWRDLEWFQQVCQGFPYRYHTTHDAIGVPLRQQVYQR